MSRSSKARSGDLPRSSRPICEILRVGHSLFIQNLPRRILKYFHTPGLRLAANGGALACRMTTRPMYSVHHVMGVGGATAVRRTFANSEVKLLMRHDVRYRITSRFSVHNFIPGAEAACTDEYKHGFMLQAIGSRQETLIKYQPGAIPVDYLLAEICYYFAGQRIVIVVSRKDEARALAKRLVDWGFEARWTAGNSYLEGPDSLIWVVTQLGQTNLCVRQEWAGLVIATDALEASRERCHYYIVRAHRARLVGLLPAYAQVAPDERDRLLATFGPEPVEIHRFGFRTRAVRVVAEKVYGGSVELACQDVELKRRAIWRHEVRNRRIKRLIAELVDPDATRLCRNFPIVGATLGNRNARRLTVLVDSLEHAKVLGDMMPDAKLVVGEADDMLPVSSGVDLVGAGVCVVPRPPLWLDPSGAGREYQPGLLNTSGAGRNGCLQAPVVVQQAPDGVSEPGVMIVTSTMLPCIGLDSVDVLIRADAGVGLPPGLTIGGLQATLDLPELIIVDFADRHHPGPRNWYARRLQAYAVAGWAIGPDDRAGTEAFLLTRPKEGRRS